MLEMGRELFSRPDNPLEHGVFAETLTGETVCLLVAANDTLETINAAIMAKTHCKSILHAVPRQRIAYKWDAKRQLLRQVPSVIGERFLYCAQPADIEKGQPEVKKTNAATKGQPEGKETEDSEKATDIETKMAKRANPFSLIQTLPKRSRCFWRSVSRPAVRYR